MSSASRRSVTAETLGPPGPAANTHRWHVKLIVGLPTGEISLDSVGRVAGQVSAFNGLTAYGDAGDFPWLYLATRAGLRHRPTRPWPRAPRF